MANGEKVPLLTLITTYLSYFILILLGHLRDFVEIIMFPQRYSYLKRQNDVEPLYSIFESFYTRRLYTRIRDCWNKPIIGVPGRFVSVLERISLDGNKTFQLTGAIKKSLNFGSYNYLGLSTNEGDMIEEVIRTAREYPVNYPGEFRNIGKNPISSELEKEMADFLYKEDCIVFPMGFGTNSCNIPVIMGEGSLILSDELNHTSIVYGARLSGATVKRFAHNDMKELERLLIYHISQGQTVTHRSWRKIFVLVEGIYSMEGTVLNLQGIVELKKRYKFYLFIDEAHSIGAIGETGRGVCEYTGVDFDEVDILMGTFTKSFGASGGYIAGCRKLVNYLRRYSDFSLYGEQLAPAVARQALEGLRCIRYTERGKVLIKRVHENTVYFRRRLIEMGYVIFGDEGSPVVPLLIYNPGKIAEFSRLCFERRLAVVVVGYPATPVISSRVRFCISASHRREDVENALEVINYCGTLLGMNVMKKGKWLPF
jgi:serine palmitoyltransferase